ncbi:helix-turn-helix transcriptional regulator [Roseimaritima sediminicola]|uniref:helix-turn-helix transcriptional regulator n=1 Tax=Roseimaritima sediminicola TaxID=2662066 RepID=UPI00129841CE|nr:helix-turn-helix domain-containing protein [Roseimaritima sediminicola]
MRSTPTDATMLHGCDPDTLVERITAAVLDQIRPLIERRAGGLLSREGLAEHLGVSESHVDGLTRSGEIPCIRLGRSVRYDTDAVLAALQEKNGGAADE